MAECAKTHLQQSRISIFFRGRTPGLPSSRGGKAGEGRRGEAGEREGRGSLGKGGEGREGTGEGRREGRNGVLGRVGEGMGARHWFCPPPLETSSGSAPATSHFNERSNADRKPA